MLHPIVAQMCPSPEQVAAICGRGHDVAVTAGAGTGKTRTLVARYLSLLAEGLPLRSIVAITFTQKAAREMRNRVRDEIRRYLEQDGLDRAERQHWRDLYSELDAARIGTIHSLCTEILRAHPAEARVDPRFEVLEEGPSNILRAQTVEEALAWAADNSLTVALFAVVGEQALRDHLQDLLSRRLDAAAAFSALPADLLSHWEQELARRQERAWTSLWSGSVWAQAETTLRANRALQPDDLLEIECQEVLAALSDARVRPLPACLDCMGRLERIKLGGGKAKAWPGGREQQDAVKQALATLRGLWKERPAVLHLALNPLDEAIAENMAALEALFTFASARYVSLKQEGNHLDFDDLEQGALEVLRDHKTARARWQRDVQAMLVDEFQDTNFRQRDLVNLLSGDRRCLFIVGDGKQGIYRFRGADVTVFRAERERIAAQAGESSLSLDISYRAHTGLIQLLNDLLRPVLGKEFDPERPWVEPFAPLQPRREKPGPGFAVPHLELHLTVGSKRGGALERAASALAWRIIELKGTCAVSESNRDDSTPLDFSDFAILCRASSSFPHYENALEWAGVPFLTVAGRGFYERPEIRDLLNALAAMADPSDDLALAGLLRSPAMALSDEALYRLCQERRHMGKGVPLWQVLHERADCLAGENRGRAERAATIIADLHIGVGRTTVADLLKGFLDATGYRAALMQAGQNRGARNVTKLLSDAHASGIVGVGEFLEHISSLRGSGAREGEARIPAEGAVQIMTIHQAKGLEFPVVVIGDITYEGHRRNTLLLDAELGVLLPKKEGETLPAIYALGKQQASDQESAEADRLFYVAATRASEKLIFSGCINLSQSGSPSRPRGWLGRIAGPLGLEQVTFSHDEEGDRAISLELQIGQSPVGCTVYEPRWSPPARPLAVEDVAAPAASASPPLLTPVTAGEEHVDEKTAESERDPPRRVWRVVPVVERPTAPAWVVGSLVHEALAAWRFPEQTQFVRWTQARARSYGLTDPRQIDDAVAETRRLLQRFCAHWLFQEMDSAEERLHEVPYSLLVAGRLESGIIDALYRREGTWTVVEFKTDDVRDEAQLADLLEREGYREQAQRYAAAVERLVGHHPRVILCLLNYRGAVTIRSPHSNEISA